MLKPKPFSHSMGSFFENYPIFHQILIFNIHPSDICIIPHNGT